MTDAEKQAKIEALIYIEGFDSISDMLTHYATDDVCPAICCNPLKPECDYVDNMEPDQDQGWCVECEANSMVSAMVLAGII